MAIVKTVSFYDFERAFIDYGRNDNFSYGGKQILFDYLENLSEDIGEPFELDVIALCCEYTEMSLIDILKDYGDTLGFSVDQFADLEISEEDIIDELINHTSVCGQYYCEDIENIVVVFQTF